MILVFHGIKLLETGGVAVSDEVKLSVDIEGILAN